MKQLFYITVVSFFIIQSFAQSKLSKDNRGLPDMKQEINNHQQAPKWNSLPQPVFYLVNDLVFNSEMLVTIDNDKIETVRVRKDPFEKDGIHYHGTISIKLKSDYEPNFITLMDLAIKQFKIDTENLIFKINGNIVNSDYSQFYVDENFLLKITTDNLETSEFDSKFQIISLQTKPPKPPKQFEKKEDISTKGMQK